MSDDKSLLIKTPYDDKFGDLLGGHDTLCGRNDRWVQKRIYQLERIDRNKEQQQELENKRVEFGLTRTGTKKPKVCWTFVHNGQCHHKVISQEKGNVYDGMWHPGADEAAYLKKKSTE